MFQSTPPRGRRLFPLSGPSSTGKFQSTPPRGRRHGEMGRETEDRCFNPRLREGGDAPGETAVRRVPKFQSTPPRGRRRGPAGYKLCQGFVSIHASAREATQPADPDAVQRFMFQSTPPRGRRHTDPQLWTYLANVSIHASAREATRKTNRPAAIAVFQSTPPRGRRRPWAGKWHT